MLTANTDLGDRIVAKEAVKKGVRYFCPECHSEVILKQGKVLTAHFAHKPPVSCYYGSGESEQHRRAKEEISKALQFWEDTEYVEIEKSFGDVRADIYAVIRNVKVAIEIQKSTLTPEIIVKRTEAYTKKGIYILWIALADERINKYSYIPKWWEKWLHAAYFGRLYYWEHLDYVIPVSFGDVQTYVEETSWGGGYMKTLKRYKRPIQHSPVSIVESFTPAFGKAWSYGSFQIPNRLIFTQRKEIK
ncbi:MULTISPECIES: competence protein CoiA [unclassified Providencia]|uniref:competence protein CoiA n=1 Tax=unclassified Providencia TaxID=2633465 RepID=UPI00234A0347|nr:MULTISPECIES: competence protein CoiA family protein [unclassified Providencia]